MAERNVPDRGRSGPREDPADLFGFQDAGAAADPGAAGCGVSARGSRGRYHDQPVEVAGLGLFDFLLRGRTGPVGLQAERGRATAVAGALEGEVSDRRVL